MTRFLLIIFFILVPFKAIALIEVDITRGNLSPLPIAVSPLSIDENSRKNFEKILKQKNIASEISSAPSTDQHVLLLEFGNTPR